MDVVRGNQSDGFSLSPSFLQNEDRGREDIEGKEGEWEGGGERKREPTIKLLHLIALRYCVHAMYVYSKCSVYACARRAFSYHSYQMYIHVYST